VRPFVIDIPEAALGDLRDRLARTRWPAEIPGAGWSDGIPVAYAQDLARYWLDGYDWRRHERRLNEFPQYTTTIDGQDIHFLHVRSAEPDALPLVLTHGWPGSVAEFAGIIGPLTDPRAHGGDPADAFHVIAPSIPGFCFSGPVLEAGWDIPHIARAWAELMRRLGYDRYGAQGGDFGSIISPELGRCAPGQVAGVHVNALITPGPDDPGRAGGLSKSDRKRLAHMREWHQERSGYAAIQSTRPETVAYGLADSPAGQLAWNAEWFADYGDKVGAIDRDVILTNVSLYWLTNTAASAARLYREASAVWRSPSAPSPVPTGIAVFAGDSSIRKYAEKSLQIIHWSEFDCGGHFAAIEAPGPLAGDIREFFRQVR
jgi:pimeloyl-ACP methyl ester carboxylesterase